MVVQVKVKTKRRIWINILKVLSPYIDKIDLFISIANCGLKIAQVNTLNVCVCVCVCVCVRAHM